MGDADGSINSARRVQRQPVPSPSLSLPSATPCLASTATRRPDRREEVRLFDAEAFGTLNRYLGDITAGGIGLAQGDMLRLAPGHPRLTLDFGVSSEDRTLVIDINNSYGVGVPLGCRPCVSRGKSRRVGKTSPDRPLETVRAMQTN